MSFVSLKNGPSFGEDRLAYIYAISRRESSSNLSLSDTVRPNLQARNVHNGKIAGYGFIGYFQFGESALYDLGYFKPPFEFNGKSSSSFQKSLNINDWNGTWTGLDGVTSKSTFLKDRTIQIKAFNNWINTLCIRLNSQNLNEFYGVRIGGVEITESGCIAGAHLKGPKYVLEFVQGLGNSADAFGTQVGEYISLFAHYDLESCCNRKIYINVIDEGGNPVLGQKVIIESEYKEGKYYSKIGKISNDYKTNNEGKIPVIVRHPNTKIKVIIDDKKLEITQQKDKIESYTIKLTKEISVPVVLEQNSTPQPKPQSDKTPQEVRNEQNSFEDKKEVAAGNTKEVSFNIQIIEEDTRKAISYMSFYLTYKGNIKKHTADSSGTKKGIVAEVGEDIEVTVSGAGQPQKIHHFKVEQSLSNQTIKIKLPVCSFKINVKENNKNVTNTLVSIFYRNKQITKRTDSNGDLNVKMLLGFVFGFGIKNKELEKLRVLKGIPIRYFKVNEGFVKASKLYEIADQKRKGADELKKKSDQMQQKQQQDAQEKKAKEQSEKAKSESEKNQSIQDNTYTENGGKPLTTASKQSPSTSDTTRYHIYHNGKIKRENKAATGYAQYIYYDSTGTSHNLGKSKYVVAKRWSSKNVLGSGNVYLVDVRHFDKYRSGVVGYKILMNSGQQRYYLGGIELAAFLGALCKSGYDDICFNGFSRVNGDPGESKSHINGEAGDLRYLRTDKKPLAVILQDNIYDHERTLNLINNFIIFGWGKSKKMLSEYFTNPKVGIKSNYIFPNCKHLAEPRHNNHLHLQGLSPNLEDI